MFPVLRARRQPNSAALHRRPPHPQAGQTGAAARDARPRFGSSWTAVLIVQRRFGPEQRWRAEQADLCIQI